MAITMTRKWQQSKLHALFIMALLSLTACGETAETATAVEVIRPVLINTVTTSQVEQLTFNGVVQSSSKAALAFKVGGRLSQLLVDEGDTVTAGQLLASMDNREFEIARDSAQSEFTKAKLDFERGTKISSTSQLISQSELDQLRTQFEIAKNRLADAQYRYDNTLLFAPFAGKISKKHADNFTQVQANQIVLSLHDVAQMEVVIDVPTGVMLKQPKSEQAFAESSLLPGVQLPLTLKHYSTLADNSQSYQVVLAVDDAKGFNLLPGMAVKVVAHNLQQQQVISIPLQAIMPDNLGSTYVWKVDAQQQTVKQLVTLGAIIGDQVQVVTGLSLGDRYIAAGVSSLTEGTQVRPLAAKGSLS